MSSLALASFWICCFLLFYIYAGYPILMVALARFFGRPVRTCPFDGSFSVIIAAFNEGHSILGKVENILSSSIASQVSEIIIASDGSTDEMVEIVRDLSDPRVKLVEFEARRGKAAVLNDVVPQCVEDLVVLSDARQEWAENAVELLLSPFADPEVGAVSGELVFRAVDTETGVSQGMGQYWRYEKLIRRSESRFCSVPGATGALYAIRRELFSGIPQDTLLDDVVIPMQIILSGYRCVFAEGAIVFDDFSPDLKQESVRKRRTIAGNLQLMRIRPEWLVPWRNPIWFQFVSHKLLRLLSPFLLLLLLVSNGFLLDSSLYVVVLVLQGLFYLSAFSGRFLQSKGRAPGLLGVALAFVTLNVTTALAWKDAASGAYDPKWAQIGPK